MRGLQFGGLEKDALGLGDGEVAHGVKNPIDREAQLAFPALAGALQDAGVLDVADDEGDLGWDLAGFAGVGNGGGIGTFAGTNEAESKCAAVWHGSYIS